ncbi:hypothetical protein T439DRAFT_354078 [Meredithblackwellia eburnea MCA 4105]
MLTREEVVKHSRRDSCWIVIHSKVYDITNFLKEGAHPGGDAILLKYAGKDATEAFEPLHPGGVLAKFLAQEDHLGPVTGEDIVSTPAPKAAKEVDDKPTLEEIVSLRDFELAAPRMLSPTSYVFKAGADSEYAAQWNRDSWSAIRFRPRVLVPVDSINPSTTLFGHTFSQPFFICPAGGGKMAHPKGETELTKAAGKAGVLHWICCMAGRTKEEIAAERMEGQTTFWQIYAMQDLSITEKEIKEAIKLGYKGFALTVDGVYLGKRERDMRLHIANGGGAGVSGRSPVYQKFTWKAAVHWLKTLTDLPIAIKGIQSHEDARLCMEYGVHPWLSNHGGRQLEGAPSAAETLVSIRENCPEVFDKCEVIVDGGIMRGTDVVKALALGASMVGLGRAFLYSLAFGEEGVHKAIEILTKEVETAMALVGVSSVKELKPEHVDVRGLLFAGAFPRPHL